MFTLLNPSVLIGLAAVSIPLLIHLFTRQKSKTILFSTLKFLKELQQQQIRRLKIRQILLLILRSLIILCLIFAFARPTLKTSRAAAPGGGAHASVVIVLDNTLSMGRVRGGRRLLAAAKEKAKQVLTTLRSGDEIFLLFPGEPPEAAFDGARYNPETVAQAVGETELSYKSSDLRAALEMAGSLLQRSKNINRELYIISDLQKTALGQNGKPDEAITFPENTRVFLLPVPAASQQNMSLADMRLVSQIVEKGKVVELLVHVKNNGKQKSGDKLVHLFVNGKRVAQNTISLDAGASTDVLFRFVPEEAGFQRVYAQLEEDEFPEDNQRFLSFYIPEKIRVLLVGGSEADTHYLRLALSPDKNTKAALVVRELTFRQLATAKFSDFDVLVFTDVPRFDEAVAARVQKYVRAGGGLMVFLGPAVDLRNYNTGLHAKLNLPQLTAPITGSDNQFLSFGKIDFSHPLFRGVFNDRKSVVSPHIRKAIGVQSKISISKIIEYSDNHPFLFEAPYFQGRILYVTTAVTQEWSDLSLRGLFVPLLNRSVLYLAGETSFEQENRRIGEEITRGLEQDVPADKLAMEKPDHEAVKVQPEVRQGKYWLKFAGTDLPGFYRLMSANRVLDQWAVNILPEESTEEAFSAEDLQTALGGREITEISEDAALAEEIEQSRFGKEIWKAFVLAALVLALLEMIVFREKALKTVVS